MKIFAVGAGRNVGYYSTLELLSSGHSVVFFLRSPGAFDNDATIQPYIRSGQATVLKGDALDASSVSSAWATVNEGARVDIVLYMVGGTPVFYLRKGLVISPPNLTTHGLSNVLQAIGSAYGSNQSLPRLIAVTSVGITKLRATVSACRQAWYGALITARNGEEGVEPSEEVLHPGREQSYPPLGWLPDTVIVRPALLTNGNAAVKYKVSMEEFASYTVSRKDTAHFIGTRLLRD